MTVHDSTFKTSGINLWLSMLIVNCLCARGVFVLVVAYYKVFYGHMDASHNPLIIMVKFYTLLFWLSDSIDICDDRDIC